MPARKSLPLRARQRRSPSSVRHRSSTAARKRIYFGTFSAVLLIAAASFTWRWQQPAVEQPAVLAASDLIAPNQLDNNFYTILEQCFFPIATAYNFKLDITSGYRSSQEQDEMYALGRTEVGAVVTQAKGGRSVHNHGLAVDVVDDAKGYNIDWEKLGRIGRYCGLEHGDRGYEDLPHFQHIGDLSMDDLVAGQRPPRLALPCPLLEGRYHAKQLLSQQDLKECRADKL